MAKLVLSVDGVIIREIALTKDRMTIGRKPHNDIVIDNLAVSGEHAVIITVVNDFFLEDIDSTNGTFVNGQPVKKHFLQNGDVIELGKYKLKFLNDAGMEFAASVNSGNTLPPGAIEAKKESKSAAPSKTSGVQAVICLLNGSNAGRELKLTKALTTLGRPGVQVAVISKRPHGYFITHVQGTQFPVVNGKTLGTEAHALQADDIFELSGTRMQFVLRTAL